MAYKKSLANALKEQENSNKDSSSSTSDSYKGSSNRRKSNREGRVNIAAWFPTAVKFELDEIRLERSRKLGRKVTLQELQNEIYNDFLKKEGRAELAHD